MQIRVFGVVKSVKLPTDTEALGILNIDSNLDHALSPKFSVLFKYEHLQKLSGLTIGSAYEAIVDVILKKDKTGAFLTHLVLLA